MADEEKVASEKHMLRGVVDRVGRCRWKGEADGRRGGE